LVTAVLACRAPASPECVAFPAAADGSVVERVVARALLLFGLDAVVSADAYETPAADKEELLALAAGTR
jgi:hypothetical protein